jgi:hypothetical protein
MTRESQSRPVAVVRGGRKYNATFRQEGGMVYVDSAYGSSKGLPIGKKDPKIIAETALGVIVAQQDRF